MSRHDQVQAEVNRQVADKPLENTEKLPVLGVEHLLEGAKEVAHGLFKATADFNKNIEIKETRKQRELNEAEGEALTGTLRDLYATASEMAESGNYDEAVYVMRDLNLALAKAIEGFENRRFHISAEGLIPNEKKRRREEVYSLGDFALNVKALNEKIKNQNSKRKIS